ncbi:STAS domain-containing protein [Oceanicoccus sagamiensis]|uniref:Anti-anti-sigma factor n=1 Tax=Oceanicoccus sagamiensis TaxID=716816 RepID=A0A1X9NED9_9GAMM|nr:STAS domain-containing protein [Oceanicoccus sagamiensis]ARN75414.1 anti-anti-sigma factor [Oceanicoccus sagamiensis]
MAISSSSSADASELTINIEGRFDFSSHQEFRRSYEVVSNKPASYIIDMKATSYLDSSALGMLLLLRDYAGGDNSNISIANCNDDVKKILSISNFEQLFKIS